MYVGFVVGDAQRRAPASILGGVVVALLGFMGAFVGEAYSSQQELIEDRQLLEREIKFLTEDSRRIEVENVKLEHRLFSTVSELDVMHAYMLDLPFPAWIKLARKGGGFEMMALNSAFEDYFGIRMAAYIGLTDREAGLWPDEIVDEFEAGDTAVYNSRHHKCFKERVRSSAGDSVTVCKWPVKIDERRVGVGGAIVDRLEVEEI